MIYALYYCMKGRVSRGNVFGRYYKRSIWRSSRLFVKMGIEVVAYFIRKRSQA